MKRRTLDFLFSAGGIALAVLLLVLGLVMTSNANFAKGYVKDQLSQQNITFKTGDALTAEEKQSACLVKYAGQPLTTGKQAECYANDFIGLHVKSIADGQTYADLGAPQSDLRAKVAAAQKANDPALPDLQKQLTAITAQRETLFKGETLRGLLLTSFGFSVFGVKGEQVATVPTSSPRCWRSCPSPASSMPSDAEDKRSRQPTASRSSPQTARRSSASERRRTQVACPLTRGGGSTRIRRPCRRFTCAPEDSPGRVRSRRCPKSGSAYGLITARTSSTSPDQSRAPDCLSLRLPPRHRKTSNRFAANEATRGPTGNHVS